MNRFIIFICFMALLCACTGNEKKTTPWGTVIGEQEKADGAFTLHDIIANGEMIMLTLPGPEYYYDYHGHGFGTQYLLCQLFAQQIGVTLRVELCKDTTEMIERLRKGDADVLVFPLPDGLAKDNDLLTCGAGSDSLSVHWAVRRDNQLLADTLTAWYRPSYVKRVHDYEDYVFSERSIQRHVYQPVISEAKGLISNYDHLFQRYASVAGVDWRLLAALAYQESCFDPNAKSWAGACGLMQLMPSTAAHLGLSGGSIFQPEANVSASAKYIRELFSTLADVSDREERINFMLACYNGGNGHVRDAMALTRKYGGNPYRWADVSQFILKLSEPRFYQDPVVKYGYMRGTETFNYVSLVRQRYMKYCGFAGGSYSPSSGASGMDPVPHPASRPHRFTLD